MKISKVPIFRTGIFVIVCFGLLVIALFAIGNKEKLFSATHKYYVKIREVSGLKDGAQVEMSGMNVGSVDDIRLPRFPGDSVFVTLNIVKQASDLLRRDSHAEVVTEGLVGNKAISITVGSASGGKLSPGDTLLGESPMDLMGIVQSASSTVGNAEMLLKETTELIKALREGRGSFSKLLNDSTLYGELLTTVKGAGKSIAATQLSASAALASIGRITDSLSTTLSDVNAITNRLRSGQGTVGKLLADEELYNKLLSISSELASSAAELKESMNKVSRLAGNGAEVSEALKHNFLVRQYFEDRGYWNTANFDQDLESKIDSLVKLQKTVDAKLKELKK
jgi:phospholipid/cholesterol/gamma-HCH transport system substrate-binding protein